MAAIILAVVEYIHRKSPLHRNRITYWILSTITLLISLALVMSQQASLELWGAGIHWLGALLLTYVILNPQLPDIATGVRTFLHHVLITLIPVAISIGISLGVVYLIGTSPVFMLQLTQNVFLGMVIAGVLVFILYQPLSSLARRFLNRILFGQRYEAQEVVREYSQAISHVISLEGLTATAMELIDRALGVLKGTLLVIEESDGHYWWMRVMPGLGVPFGQPRLILREDSPLTAWFVDRQEPLHQYTIDIDPRFEAHSPREVQEWRQLNMEVFLPIKRSDALIGVMALGLRRSGRSYTNTDLNLLATLADQTGVALENATLFDHAQRRAEELALLNEIGKVITTSIDLEPTVELISKRIENAFKGSRGFIFLKHKTRNELVLHSTFGQKNPKTTSFSIQPGQGLLGKVAEGGKPVLVADLQSDSRYDPEIEGLLVPKAKAAICVPVRSHNETIGVILMVGATRTSLRLADLSLLDSIASFASIAIENARQVAVREETLRRQVEALKIEIDVLRREQQVDDIVETDFFQNLRARAQEMRRRKSRPRRKKPLKDLGNKPEE